MLFEGVFRRFIPIRSGRGPADARFTFTESLATAQVEPSGTEMTRAGRRYVLGYNVAPTGAIPSATLITTTTPQWILWNADPVRSCFFETLGMFMTAGTVTAVGGVLFAAIITAPAQVGAQYTGATVTSLSGGNTSSKLLLKAGVAITGPAAPTWFPIAENNATNVGAFPGSANFGNKNIAGRLAIQPGQGLALYVLMGTGTNTAFYPYAEWVELETDME